MKEDAALKQAQKNIEALNYNVNSKIQALFDRFNFTYPCKWNGNSIIVLDEYCIDPPYNSVTVLPNCEGKTKDMFSKMVSIVAL